MSKETARDRSETPQADALPTIDRQLSEMLDISSDAIMAWTKKRGIVRWNRGAVSLYGVSGDDARGHYPGDLVASEWPGGWEMVWHALERDGEWDGEVRHVRHDGQIVWTTTHLQRPQTPPSDMEVEDLPVMRVDRDTTSEREAERRLRAQQSMQRQMLDGMAAFIGVLEPDGRVRTVNRTAYKAANISVEEVVGVPFEETIWWDVGDTWRARLRNAIEQCAQGVRIREDLPWRAADGSIRWVDFQMVPVLDDAGQITALLPTGLDITERKVAETQRQVMTDELNHRVKNNLAVVRSIAIQTFGRDDARSAVFGKRLEALGAAHNLLARAQWIEADLATLIEDTVGVCCDGDRRIVIEGPAIRLKPQPATSYALAFHELCTNAITYGALSGDTGTVRVEWRVEDGEDGRKQLTILWSEHDGPPVSRPERTGFGTRMISGILGSDIRGTVDMDYRPDGLRVTMTAPLLAVSVP